MFRCAENQIPTSRKLGVRTLTTLSLAENRNFLWLFLTVITLARLQTCSAPVASFCQLWLQNNNIARELPTESQSYKLIK